MCKKYNVDRAPLTYKIAAKAIQKLNAAQHMHEGLYHQDVVGLEQEYANKMAQFSEQSRASKTPKVDFSEQCAASSNNVVQYVNEVPTNPSNNEVAINLFTGMHPTALEHLIKKSRITLIIGYSEKVPSTNTAPYNMSDLVRNSLRSHL